MLRSLLSLVLGNRDAQFEGYYQRVLDSEGRSGPNADEARRDYQRSLAAHVRLIL